MAVKDLLDPDANASRFPSIEAQRRIMSDGRPFCR